MAREKICGIYKIENLVNEKVYIGQSINVNKRLKYHKSALKNNRHKNKHLQSSFNKYGENAFTFDLLEQCNEDVIDDKEIYWINFYDSRNNDNGYNYRYGGNLNHYHSEKSKEKMRLAKKGIIFSEKHKQNLSLAYKGKKLSEEHKNKIKTSNKGKVRTDKSYLENLSKIHKGKVITEEQRKKISDSKIKINNDKIQLIREKYNTGKYTQDELAKEFKVSQMTISHIVNYKYRFAKIV